VRAIRVMDFKSADVIAGFRHDRTDEGLRRILYSFAYNWLIRILFGLKIRDVNFSFKLLRTDRLHAMDLRSEGSFIDAEMMVYADRSACSSARWVSTTSNAGTATRISRASGRS
jgi:hypothetical protein